MEKGVAVKGRWFGGDRSLEQQLMGLEPMLAGIRGRSVLDVGCAEGAISLECAKRGARDVTGLEIRSDAVAAARSLAHGGPHRDSMAFYVADANTFTTTTRFDVVLMLAVLHKLKSPGAACRRLAALALELAVIRLPPASAPSIIDARSGHVPCNIDTVMNDLGFSLDLQHSGYTGPLGEWMGYYRRQD